MLLQRFTDHQGQLAPARPTFGSFRAYFYSRNYNKSPRKIIARDRLSHYQRNCQPAFGTASAWRKFPGSFQMDATEADIYLLSDSGAPFRPYIYLAVDSATQLIAGVWVGESCDEMSVMRCLENCVQDKTEWCGRHGITITPEQWPSHGLPYEVVTDKGREFCGARMQELCRRYGKVPRTFSGGTHISDFEGCPDAEQPTSLDIEDTPAPVSRLYAKPRGRKAAPREETDLLLAYQGDNLENYLRTHGLLEEWPC